MDRILKYLNPSEREGLENLISLTFVILALIYVTVFLGDFYVYVKALFLKNFPELRYLELVLKYGVVVIIPVVYTRFFLFAHDSLAFGNDKYARFFQTTLPSGFLRDEFRVDQKKANELWFRIFNVWKNESHPRNPQWYATFRRTYSCRFIYHLQRWLVRAVVLFAVTVVADSGHKWLVTGAVPADGTLLVRLIVIAVTFLIALMLSVKNRVGVRPTGCWARLVEIEEGHKAWLEQEVVKPSGGDFDRAWKLAEAWEARWNPGPPQSQRSVS